MLGSVMMTTDSIGHASNRYDHDAYGTAYIRDGSNWFAYCNGDPVNFVDLLGLEAGDKLAEVSNGVATPVGETWNDAQNVTSTWGNRKSFDTGNGVTADGHNGMDYGAKKGTRINAIKDGTVTKVE